MKQLRIIILRNEIEDDHANWISAIESSDHNLLYKIVDITKHNWLEQILEFNPELFLVKPGGFTAPYKQLYDERLYILVREMGYKCFPSLNEVLIYENKRFLSYWLKAHQVPHPKSSVFYNQREAIDFINSVDFPIVGKVNIGASGSGVTLLHSKKEATDYITRTFTGKGANMRVGPNLRKGNILGRGVQYIRYPSRISKKLNIYKARASDAQKDFVIFQEYINHDFEWRVVRIGHSFFAHKKLKLGEKASGSILKDYSSPPLALLDFVRELTEKHRFYSQAVDIFETDKDYLVNEMQCIFGQSEPHLMMIEGLPGRYIYKKNNWEFQTGEFNAHESYDLRLATAVELYAKGEL